MSSNNLAPKISLSLGVKRKAAAPPKKVNLAHSKLHDSDDEDVAAPQAQEVSGFDQSAGGAISSVKDARSSASQGPKIIPSQRNRDWREASRRGRQKKISLSADAQGSGGQNGSAQPNGTVRQEDPEDRPTAYGLNVVRAESEATQNGATAAGHQLARENAQERQHVIAQAQHQARSADDEALEALLGNRPQKQSVIGPVANEEEAFQRDYAAAPDMASLEAYAAMPVEEFGAALLRGWAGRTARTSAGIIGPSEQQGRGSRTQTSTDNDGSSSEKRAR